VQPLAGQQRLGGPGLGDGLQHILFADRAGLLQGEIALLVGLAWS